MKDSSSLSVSSLYRSSPSSSHVSTSPPPPDAPAVVVPAKPNSVGNQGLGIHWGRLLLRLEFVSSVTPSPPLCSQDLPSPALDGIRKSSSTGFRDTQATGGNCIAWTHLCQDENDQGIFSCALRADGEIQRTWAQSGWRKAVSEHLLGVGALFGCNTVLKSFSERGTLRR